MNGAQRGDRGNLFYISLVYITFHLKMGASQSQDSEPNVESKSVKQRNLERDVQKLRSLLDNGVFLNHKRMKYWVDKKSNKNCFILFARDLSITWAENENYWKWSLQQETASDVSIDVAKLFKASGREVHSFIFSSDVSIDVAELLDVCWLEVRGKFDVTKLSPKTLYEVFVIVMLRDEAYGWEAGVTFGLTLPDGQKVEHKEDLKNKPRGKWIGILVGEFTTSCENVRELEIYFHEIEGGSWKRGLVVKGVAILPKNQDGIKSGRRL